MFFQTTITLPIVRLQGLLIVLDKVEAQAKIKWMTDAEVLDLRLAPDMFSFVKQIQIATDNAKGMASRMAHHEIPSYEDNESSLAEIRARLEKTIAYLETFAESDFENGLTGEFRSKWMPGIKLVGEGYILTYGLPNFFFHVVMAYAILRNAGFDIGKWDYMGPGLVFLPDAE